MSYEKVWDHNVLPTVTVLPMKKMHTIEERKWWFRLNHHCLPHAPPTLCEREAQVVVTQWCMFLVLLVIPDSAVPPQHDSGEEPKHRARTESHPPPTQPPPPPMSDLSTCDSPGPGSKYNANIQGRPRPIPKKPTAGTCHLCHLVKVLLGKIGRGGGDQNKSKGLGEMRKLHSSPFI